MTDQPEALRVAAQIEHDWADSVDAFNDAIRLLREQHAEIQRLRDEIERLRTYLRIIKFHAELARDYVIQLNDDCDAAVKRCKP